jgi:hypothetical protein
VRRLTVAVLAALAAALLVSAPTGAADGREASATAFGVQVSLPDKETVQGAFATAPPIGFGTATGFAYPADGSAVTVQSVSTSARTGPGAGARSSAETLVHGVRLFGGEIRADLVALESSAVATGTGAAGSLAGSRLEGLVVLGQAVEAQANQRLELGDWGYVIVLEQAVLRQDRPTHGYRGFVTGLHVHLTADHGGLPAGSEILVGYAEAAAQSPQPAPPPPPAEPGSGGQADGGVAPPTLPDEPQQAPPGATGGPPPIVLNPPPGVRPQITGQGYVFPVYGPVSFTNDFAAPRADTGWHHGNDIFAPLGAPILAVADGTLFNVGWNDLGGHRLWLRDRQGNEYYYAHLSAYSPLAFDGAQVQAGDVIGFVGDSGDAVGTPYHLHFEVHPSALLGLGYDGVVNPYSYLLAWSERHDATAFASAAPAPAPAAPAAILQAEDISSASGLEPGALERAYAGPLLLSAVAGLVLPGTPDLVGADPGFGLPR